MLTDLAATSVTGATLVSTAFLSPTQRHNDTTSYDGQWIRSSSETHGTADFDGDGESLPPRSTRNEPGVEWKYLR